jgi:hypothetical protein
LKVTDTVAVGGTDAPFAAQGNMKPVIERFGLLSFARIRMTTNMFTSIRLSQGFIWRRG